MKKEPGAIEQTILVRPLVDIGRASFVRGVASGRPRGAGRLIRVGRLLLLLIAIVLVQTAVLPYARVFGVVPDLGLVATVAIAYREGPELGSIFGFAAGLAMDLFLQTPLGLTALAFALTGYVIGILQGALAAQRLVGHARCSAGSAGSSAA